MPNLGLVRTLGVLALAGAAPGNSDGDLQMLQWTAARKGASFCLYVRHDDAAREWAYDRESHVGRLDRGLDEAKARGWTVVSMKSDWKVIWSAGSQGTPSGQRDALAGGALRYHPGRIRGALSTIVR